MFHLLSILSVAELWQPVWETAVRLAVAGVFDDVFLYCPFFPLGVLNEIWDVIESVSEGFPTYSCYICESACLFNLSLNLISMFLVSKITHLEASNLPSKPKN